MPLGYSAPCPSVGDAFISQLWLSGCVYAAGCLYIVLACISLGLLFIEITSKRKGAAEWKLRPLGLSLVYLLCSVETAFWFVLGSTYWTNNKLYFALSTFPQVLYCILLFLCMYLFGTIFYQVYFTSVLSEYEISLRQQRRAKIQLVVSVVSLMMWCVFFALSFAMSPTQYELIQSIVGGVINLVAGCSFPLYLMYLYRLRNAQQHKIRARYQHRLLQCLTVTVLVSLCAIGRGILQLTWRQLSSLLSREVYWCLSVCSYAVFEMMPLGWLLVLLRVVPSLDANFVLVGTADSEYWINRSTQSVLGHDFFVVGQAQGGSSTSSGEEHQALLN